MQIMNFDRLAKIKCIVCGSRKKDVSDIMTKNNQILAKVSVCCGCGLTQIYANSSKAVAGLLIHNMGLAKEGMLPEPTEMFEHREMLEIVVNPIETNI